MRHRVCWHVISSCPRRTSIILLHYSWTHHFRAWTCSLRSHDVWIETRSCPTFNDQNWTNYHRTIQLTPGRTFLDASSHLYMRVCPSVGPSVRRSVRRFVRGSRFRQKWENWFSHIISSWGRIVGLMGLVQGAVHIHHWSVVSFLGIFHF